LGAGVAFGIRRNLSALALSLTIMKTAQPATDQTQLHEARRQNALAQLRRRYEALDKLTGKTAAERVEALRQHRTAR